MNKIKVETLGKILYLVIGILAGAIIATFTFLMYSKTLNKVSDQPGMMQGGNSQMQPPSNENMGEPPALPNQNGQNGGTPPEKPTGDNQQTEKEA